MKKLLRSILTIALCAVLAITAAGTETAYAASKKMPAKVTLDEETVTFSKDIKKGLKKISIKSVEKKWGEATETGDNYYCWKSGTSFIECFTYKKNVQYIQVYVQDENSSMFGITCGMTEKTALKKLKKYGFKESELDIDEGAGLGEAPSSTSRLETTLKHTSASIQTARSTACSQESAGLNNASRTANAPSSHTEGGECFIIRTPVNILMYQATEYLNSFYERSDQS